MTEFYGPDLAAIHAGSFEALAASAADTLVAHFPSAKSPGRLLDLGCGAGPLSQRLLRQGFKAWGVDVSPAFIQHARARAPEGEFVCGSILDVVLPRASAAVAAGEVLNYATADDPDGLVRVVRRVFSALDAGGVFLLDLAGPGRAGFGQAFSEGGTWAVGMRAAEFGDMLVRKITTFRQLDDGDWRRSYEEHHLRLWSPAVVTDRLRDAGFFVEQLPGYRGMVMPPALHVYLARKQT